MEQNRHDKLNQVNWFDELLRIRDAQRKRRQGAIDVIKAKDVPKQLSQHGFLQYYMHPSMDDVCLNTQIFSVLEIPPDSRSGKQHHPGGMVIFVWSGKGYTVINGVKYSWTSEDLIQLPLLPEGVIYQHFNEDPEHPAKLIQCEPNFVDALGLDRGSRFEVLESCPEYTKGVVRSV